MKALVFQGRGQASWQDVPDPAVDDAADAVARVETGTACGPMAPRARAPARRHTSRLV
ncbi:hypothetical protein AB0J57_02040 [Streptomyces sp. NPDC049837]|uniref:hypothetical protein n=1 Tax=Streptomyces sp. NPDC049837 TaxID=3155277 RepID=UPI00341743E4